MCEKVENSTESAVQEFDANSHTPLFNAVQNGHLKCIEVLLLSDTINLSATDSTGNSVYHICAATNNFEALRYFLTRKDPKYRKALYIKNAMQDHVIHVACFHGNLEIVRLVLTKINEDSQISAEAFLASRNSMGHTCFHIACIRGHINNIEYFLKDLKMRFFLRFLDSQQNSCLHLAVSHNHFSLVSLLLTYGIDVSAKNRDHNTALEIGFQKGFYDIIKLLVNANSNRTIQEDTRKEYPLHSAAHEGSSEIVRLLLSKGMPIDTLDRAHKNCLDIAIEQDKRDVIKVLLKDPQWQKLFVLRRESRPG